MSSVQLSRHALNRALLARQHLLRPAALPAEGPTRDLRVIEMVEHLAGLQAQAPFPPYYGLWSRLDGFRPDDLSALLTGRQVVRIALMRGTIHLVSARDCLAMRPLMQPVLDRGLAANFGRQLPTLDREALAAAGRALVEQAPMTFSEIGASLAGRWPECTPAALAQGVRALVPLVQVPPRAVWGAAGQARHTTAESWLAPPPASPAGTEGAAGPAGAGTLEGLVMRYLAAFGPASVRDVQAWSGLTRLGEVTGRLRPRLLSFRDENGVELFDLPDAPRPDPQTPAGVRMIAEFDNLLLSHADRSRIISAEGRQRIFTKNGIFPGTVLIDGFTAGIWRISRSADAATLTVEPFGKISLKNRAAVQREGARLLAFATPEVPGHDIRFASPA